MSDYEIKKVSIEEIRPYKNNPRKNAKSVEKVKESIKKYGFKQPIVLDKEGVVIAGHTRLEAAKKLGLKKVPVIIADDLSEEETKAYRLADNRTAQDSTWDMAKLCEELEEIDTDSFFTGFEDYEIDSILEDIDVDAFLEETDKEEEAKGEDKEKRSVTCPYCKKTFEL